MRLKRFKNFINESHSHTNSSQVEEFLVKYDEEGEYKFVVIKDGKPVSGWEYLSDALDNGVIEDCLGLSRWDLCEESGDCVDEIETTIDEEDFDMDSEEATEKLNDDLSKFIEICKDKEDCQECGEVHIKYVG